MRAIAGRLLWASLPARRPVAEATVQRLLDDEALLRRRRPAILGQGVDPLMLAPGRGKGVGGALDAVWLHGLPYPFVAVAATIEPTGLRVTAGIAVEFAAGITGRLIGELAAGRLHAFRRVAIVAPR